MMYNVDLLKMTGPYEIYTINKYIFLKAQNVVSWPRLTIVPPHQSRILTGTVTKFILDQRVESGR